MFEIPALIFLLMLSLKISSAGFLIYEDFRYRKVSVVWLGAYAIATIYFLYNLNLWDDKGHYKVSFLLALLMVGLLQAYWLVHHEKAAFGKADLILLPICSLMIPIKYLPVFLGICGAAACLLAWLQKSTKVPFITVMIIVEWSIGAWRLLTPCHYCG